MNLNEGPWAVRGQERSGKRPGESLPERIYQLSQWRQVTVHSFIQALLKELLWPATAPGAGGTKWARQIFLHD